MILYNFYKDYFSLNLKDYPNIAFDLEINKIIFCIFLGIIIAAIIINYRQYCMITLIKKLLRYNAKDISNAKSISELGIKKSYVKTAMSQNRISRIVSFVEKKEYSYEEYSAMIKKKGYKEKSIDYTKERIYIKEGTLGDANAIAEMHHPTILNTILFCILIFSSCVCIMFIMPSILNLINNLLAK